MCRHDPHQRPVRPRVRERQSRRRADVPDRGHDAGGAIHPARLAADLHRQRVREPVVRGQRRNARDRRPCHLRAGCAERLAHASGGPGAPRHRRCRLGAGVATRAARHQGRRRGLDACWGQALARRDRHQLDGPSRDPGGRRQEKRHVARTRDRGAVHPSCGGDDAASGVHRETRPTTYGKLHPPWPATPQRPSTISGSGRRCRRATEAWSRCRP